MTTEETYVTAAFLVLLAVALAYVVIYSFRMRRLQREVDELEHGREQRSGRESGPTSGA
jgi:hypothetical protein